MKTLEKKYLSNELLREVIKENEMKIMENFIKLISYEDIVKVNEVELEKAKKEKNKERIALIEKNLEVMAANIPAQKEVISMATLTIDKLEKILDKEETAKLKL